MAFGNLKFDTLTTSDAKNTSTEKSLDTSYIFNGVAKGWTHFQGTSTAASIDGFNISSIDDDGTGDYGLHFTNSMSNATYCVTFGIDDDGSASVVIGQDTTNGTMATGSFDFEAYYVNSSSNTNKYDYANHYMVINGDVA